MREVTGKDSCSLRSFGPQPLCFVPGEPSRCFEMNSEGQEPLVASLLLVVRPGAPNSVLAPSSDARSP